MPELPEVETCCKFIRDYCFNSNITNVIINELGGGPLNNQIDEIIHQTPHLIKQTLLNKTIQNIKRKGKYLWFIMSTINTSNSNNTNTTSTTTNTITNQINKINESKFVLFHFGMTGSFILKNKTLPIYKSFTISSNWPPKFTKLLITFENGEELAFCDFRRLGRIKVMDDVESEPPVSLLAKDCYTDNITGDYLFSKFQNYNVPIKTLLLDQQKVCSGIGNWIADEVLFQSHIHPSTKCNILNQSDCDKLAHSINTVITTACNVQSESEKFPNEWLFHSRWEKRRSSETIRTSEGYIVKYETIGGRTSAFVPELQKLYKTSRNNSLNETVVVDQEVNEEGDDELLDNINFNNNSHNNNENEIEQEDQKDDEENENNISSSKSKSKKKQTKMNPSTRQSRKRKHTTTIDE